MIEAPHHPEEQRRLADLRSYEILDTDPERAFDDITRLVSRICGVPVALVSLVDEQRQWFKSRVGLDAAETPRSVAFCAHAILEPGEILVVPDAFRDERFADNPIVVGEPRVRFYAGAPLVTSSGMPLGTLCVIDHVSRDLQQEQLEALSVLARQVVSQLELRRTCLALRCLARDLEGSNAQLEQFTYNAAHDLQEPLRKLISFSELLREDLGGDLPPNAEQDVGYIVDAAHRMKALVGNLLELSRTGTSELVVEPVPLEDCVRAAREALAVRIEDSGAVIEVDPLPCVQGDRTLLTQILQNLIGNALKFVGDSAPRVHVTCQVEDGRTVLGVQDNGIGFDSAHAEEVFTPFRRLHACGNYEGTGIGLSIVRKAVARHGGRIWVESVPGEGSHFKFELPGASAAVLAAADAVSVSGS